MSDTKQDKAENEQEMMHEQFPARKDNLQELKQREAKQNDDQEMREHFACTLIDPD